MHGTHHALAVTDTWKSRRRGPTLLSGYRILIDAPQKFVKTLPMLIELTCCTLFHCFPPKKYEVAEDRKITLQLEDGPCIVGITPLVKTFSGRPFSYCDGARCFLWEPKKGQEPHSYTLLPASPGVTIPSAEPTASLDPPEKFNVGDSKF